MGAARSHENKEEDKRRALDRKPEKEVKKDGMFGDMSQREKEMLGL